MRRESAFWTSSSSPPGTSSRRDIPPIGLPIPRAASRGYDHGGLSRSPTRPGSWRPRGSTRPGPPNPSACGSGSTPPPPTSTCFSARAPPPPTSPRIPASRRRVPPTPATGPRGYLPATTAAVTWMAPSIRKSPILANPAVRRAIAAWAAVSIREAVRLAPSSRIEEVSLSVDACSESSLFGSDTGGVVGFTRAYPRSASLEAKTGFYREREHYLKSAYREFADSVHAAGRAVGAPIRAGVFQQLWAMDGRMRGTFDLYALLKGSGMDALHHTQMPLDSAESLMTAAYSASVASAPGDRVRHRVLLALLRFARPGQSVRGLGPPGRQCRPLPGPGGCRTAIRRGRHRVLQLEHPAYPVPAREARLESHHRRKRAGL